MHDGLMEGSKEAKTSSKPYASSFSFKDLGIIRPNKQYLRLAKPNPT